MITPSDAILVEWEALSYPIGLIGAWAGLDEAVLNATLTTFGMHEADHARVLAALPREDVATEARAVKVNDANISLGARGKILNMYVAARFVCGLSVSGQAPPAPAPPPTPAPVINKYYTTTVEPAAATGDPSVIKQK